MDEGPTTGRDAMRAAVVHEFHQPLVLEDRPTPHPGPGQVLVAVEASGLCHTDIHAAHGDWPVKPTPPFVPGHEGVGIVAEVGAGRGPRGGRRPGRGAVARVGVRRVRVVRERLGDPVPEPAEHRLLGRRRLR